MSNPREYALRARLHELGIPSWAALGRMAGVGRTAVQNIRQGAAAQVRWGDLEKMAAALQWDPAQILNPEGKPTPPQDIQVLRKEVLQLREALKIATTTAKMAAHQQTFQHLQSLFISYPTAAAMVARDPSRLAQNLVPLFKPLDTWLQQQGMERIGDPWAPVAFDPHLHQGDLSTLMPGEPVYIRLVGYRQGDTILCPARVSRSLPSG